MNLLSTTGMHLLRNRRPFPLGIGGLAMALAALALPAAAQIAAWDFSGDNTAAASSAAEVFDAKLDCSNALTRGSGAGASAANNSFRSTGFGNNGIATANTDYFQCTLSATAGFTLSLSSLDARFSGTASYCATPGVSGQFAYSVDGSTFVLLGSPFVMTSSGPMPPLDVSVISALQNVPDATMVTIRYYASGQTTTGGWGFYSAAAGQYGLAIGGTLAASALPPLTFSAAPTSFAENAAAPAATGTVGIPTALATDLLVKLVSSDPTEASVPAAVTIAAGTTSANFPILAVNDLLVDGAQGLYLTASATGYSSAVQTLTVTDDGDAPPNLGPGAIAFVGFNADGANDLAFVALAPIAASDTIFLTDKAWNGLELGKGGAFASGEGVITWTAPAAGVAAGTVVALNNLLNTSRSASVGTLSAAGSFNLSGDGETVYAYQGTASAPTGFIAAIASWTADPTTGTCLSTSHIIHLTNHADIGAYVGSRSDRPGFATYLDAIATPANWLTEDGSGDQGHNGIAPEVPFDGTAFTLAGGTGYAVWAADHADSQTADADADGDGVPNGIEYFMGEPRGTFTSNPTVLLGKITWRRDVAAAATYAVMTSTDLVHWEPATAGVKDNGDSIEFTLPEGPTRVFVRLEVDTEP
ncbi:MAG: hypothetical protein WCK77_12345 [Verrucomicrobiota bacterium]